MADRICTYLHFNINPILLISCLSFGLPKTLKLLFVRFWLSIRFTSVVFSEITTGYTELDTLMKFCSYILMVCSNYFNNFTWCFASVETCNIRDIPH